MKERTSISFEGNLRYWLFGLGTFLFGFAAGDLLNKSNAWGFVFLVPMTFCFLEMIAHYGDKK